MSRGLAASARGDWSDGLFYLIVLSAHAGLAYLVAAVVARDLYRQGYGRVQAGGSARRRLDWSGFDALFHRLFGFLPRPIRLLILKDLRTFVRDPAQWSQFLIFFGLLAFYFANIRRPYSTPSVYWYNRWNGDHYWASCDWTWDGFAMCCGWRRPRWRRPYRGSAAPPGSGTPRLAAVIALT